MRLDLSPSNIGEGEGVDLDALRSEPSIAVQPFLIPHPIASDRACVSSMFCFRKRTGGIGVNQRDMVYVL